MHLVKTGHTQPGLDQAIFTQIALSLAGGKPMHLFEGSSLHDQVAHLGRQIDEFVDAHTAAVAGTFAAAAASRHAPLRCLPREQPRGGRLGRCQIGRSKGWLARFRAVGAQPAHQSLGLDTAHRRSHQEGFHAHVDQTREGAHRIVGMQGRKHQVTGERGLYGDLRRLQVAYLPDHDHIGILPQDRAQGGSEGQADVGMDLDLGDIGHLVFHGIFHADELAHAIIDFLQRAIERGGLARSGGAGHQDDAVGFRYPCTHPPQVVREHPEPVQAQPLALLRQQAHDHRFAMHPWQGGDPHVELRTADPDAHASILRQPSLRDVDGGDQLDPRDDRRESLAGKAQLVVQDAVDAEADTEVELPGFDVNIRRTLFHGLAHHVVDEFDYRRLLRQLPQVADVFAAVGVPIRTLPGQVQGVLQPAVQILGAAQHCLNRALRIEIAQGFAYRRR